MKEKSDYDLNSVNSGSDISYIDLVLNGIIYKSENLKGYFIRNQKLYLRDQFIEKKEFYTCCNEVVSELKKEVHFKYYSAINDLTRIQDKLEAVPSKQNLKKLEDLIPFEKHTKSKNKKIEFAKSKDNLLPMYLSVNDILHLEKSIDDAESEGKVLKLVVKDETKGNGKKNENKIKMNEIALRYVFMEEQITRVNANEIVRMHGYKSGEKLFQKFTHYNSLANRTGKPYPFTRTKLKNKISLFEKVIQQLPKDKQKSAKDELQLLKNYQIEFE